MRTALTVSAIAVAASMALAVPATAFAADAGPSPTTQSTGSPSDSPTPEAAATLSLGRSSAAPGDTIDLTVTAPAGSTAVTVSSAALGDVTLTESADGTWTGTATVAQADDGDYGVDLTGTGPDGTALQASADLTVRNDTPAPRASLTLSKDHGAPGAKVDVVIEPGDLEGAAYVTSDAFGGRVHLVEQADGSWRGTATVKGTERSYYGVTGRVGSTEVDTVKFTVTENHSKPEPEPKPSPVVGRSVIVLGTSSGKAGDKVAITFDAPSIGPHHKLDVRSTAFGGRVHLTQGKDGKWHGTATVAQVRNATYDVTSPIARSVHFKVVGGHVTPHGHGVRPLTPGGHKTPKGSVDTGRAPAAASATTSHAGAAGLLLGTGALGAASLAGAFGLRRRKNDD